MKTTLTVKDCDTVVGLHLTDCRDSCTFERQEFGEAVVYTIYISGVEAGSYTIEPPTSNDFSISTSHVLTAKKKGISKVRKEQGYVNKIPEPEASINSYFVNLCWQLDEKVQQLRREIAIGQSGDSKKTPFVERQNTDEPGMGNAETKSKRGNRGKLTKSEKIKAYKEWKELDSDESPLLAVWLEGKFGSNPDGSLVVPESTFHGWRKFVENS